MRWCGCVSYHSFRMECDLLIWNLVINWCMCVFLHVRMCVCVRTCMHRGGGLGWVHLLIKAWSLQDSCTYMGRSREATADTIWSLEPVLNCVPACVGQSEVSYLSVNCSVGHAVLLMGMGRQDHNSDKDLQLACSCCRLSCKACLKINIVL